MPLLIDVIELLSIAFISSMTLSELIAISPLRKQIWRPRLMSDLVATILIALFMTAQLLLCLVQAFSPSFRVSEMLLASGIVLTAYGSVSIVITGQCSCAASADNLRRNKFKSLCKLWFRNSVLFASASSTLLYSRASLRKILATDSNHAAILLAGLPLALVVIYFCRYKVAAIWNQRQQVSELHV